jgi:predicted transcriptional regulator
MGITLGDLEKLLEGEIVVGHEKMELSVDCCTASDLMSDVLTGPTAGSILITGLNSVQVIKTSRIANLAAIVLVRKKRPNNDLVESAREHEIPLLRTPFTMFTVCGKLFQLGLRGVEGRIK